MFAPIIDPVAFSIPLPFLGTFQVHWYGLMYVFGFLSALLLAKYRASHSKTQWTLESCDDLLTYVALGVILGGRLGYVLFYNFSYYMTHPFEIIAIWEGGMSFHGGFIGVAIAIYFFARKTKKNIIDVFDFIAPFVPQCIFLGRIGNFINGELWGKVTDAPIGMIFRYADESPRHPSQLYEAISEGLISFIILWFFSDKPHRRGAVSLVFCICYCVSRFTVEFFREPDIHIGYIAFGWLTTGQVLTLGLACIAVLVFFYSRTQPITSWRD